MSAPRSAAGAILGELVLPFVALAAAVIVLLITFGPLPFKMIFDAAPVPGKSYTPPPPPIVTKHEGPVTKIVVSDPHDGGWSGRVSDPDSVIVTVEGREYDLDGPLRQAATVKPGDVVLIECSTRAYETDLDRKPSCEFGGIVTQAPSSDRTSR